MGGIENEKNKMYGILEVVICYGRRKTKAGWEGLRMSGSGRLLWVSHSSTGL